MKHSSKESPARMIETATMDEASTTSPSIQLPVGVVISTFLGSTRLKPSSLINVIRRLAYVQKSFLVVSWSRIFVKRWAVDRRVFDNGTTDPEAIAVSTKLAAINDP
mmetsp:Transcript_18329/g.30719  ORF Transcript_18329/g.30719 Transcript_18329/m.30719 type:complete len:107 (-) Transcript_18329:58-378(-)